MRDPVRRVTRQVWREGLITEDARTVPEETAIALTYNGGTHAVMMATPADLEDFAVGFSLSERVVASPSEIETLDVVEADDGIELRMWLKDASAARLTERRRQIAGPTGCGLCGVDSIAAAMQPAAIVSDGVRVSPQQIMAAMAALPAQQTLNIATRAVHAAAFARPDGSLVALREDVGRHNALDKLGGALARAEIAGRDGLVLLTSRVSIEMVQKTARLGAGLMVSVSAPTALAIRMADEAGITLAAIARADGFEIFTHAHRIVSGDIADVVA